MVQELLSELNRTSSDKTTIKLNKHIDINGVKKQRTIDYQSS